MPAATAPFVGPRIPMSDRPEGKVWRRKVGAVSYDFVLLPQVGDGSQYPARIRTVREIHDQARGGAIVRRTTHDIALPAVGREPSAPAPREIAQQVLQAQVRDEARLVYGDRIDEHLDLLEQSGVIRGHDYEALRALADAVGDELAAAADEDRITVTITGPTP